MIVGTTEGNGRHGFHLGSDQRRRPQTFRGMVRAATALRAIDALKRQARREKWRLEALIQRAWEAKASGSENGRHKKKRAGELVRHNRTRKTLPAPPDEPRAVGVSGPCRSHCQFLGGAQVDRFAER